MSEFRDLTLALRSIHDSMTSIEECLVLLVRDSSQQSEWRHDQRNSATVTEGRWIETKESLKGIRQEITSIRETHFDAVKELRGRVRDIETGEEITKV